MEYAVSLEFGLSLAFLPCVICAEHPGRHASIPGGGHCYEMAKSGDLVSAQVYAVQETVISLSDLTMCG